MGGCESTCPKARATLVKCNPPPCSPPFLQGSPFSAISLATATFKPRQVPLNELKKSTWFKMRRSRPMYAALEGFGMVITRRWRQDPLGAIYYCVRKIAPLDPRNNIYAGNYWEIPLVWSNPATKERRQLIYPMKYAITGFMPLANTVTWITDEGRVFKSPYNTLTKLRDPDMLDAVSALANDYPKLLDTVLTTEVGESPVDESDNIENYATLNPATASEVYATMSAVDPALSQPASGTMWSGSKSVFPAPGSTAAMNQSQAATQGAEDFESSAATAPVKPSQAMIMSFIGAPLDAPAVANKFSACIGELMQSPNYGIETKEVGCPIVTDRHVKVRVPKEVEIYYHRPAKPLPEHEYGVIKVNVVTLERLAKAAHKCRDYINKLNAEFEALEVGEGPEHVRSATGANIGELMNGSNIGSPLEDMRALSAEVNNKEWMFGSGYVR